jgi:3-oxoacyl-[acyl-carrier protein] reductase
MSKLTGKVAVVTGASKGVGAGIAKGLAAEGAAVVVNYAAAREGADRVVADIEARGGKAIAIQADVSKAADVRRLFAEAVRAFGALDVLVNNAGIFQFAPLEALTEEAFHQQFNTNVLGPLLATQEAVKHFNSEGGSIINVSSVATRTTPPASAIYSGTKGAIEAVTHVLAKELAARKIRVNAIAPGPVVTEGFQALGASGSDFEKQMVAQTPLGRVGQPDDIAPVAVFLASSDSGWMTGEILLASGGYR